MVDRRVVALGAAAGLVALAARAWSPVRGAAASLQRCSAPSATVYDIVFGRLLGGLYERAAQEVTAALSGSPEPAVLEVGSGPGGLAVRLARRIPDLRYTGLDLDRAMVDRAVRRAGREGLAARLRFVEGDVAALPFDEATFDLVVSTLSVHHWADPVAGFTEIRRVLRPGGRVVIHDVAPRWARMERPGPDLAAAAEAAFGTGAAVLAVAWPGPLRLTVRLELTRPA